MSMCHFLAVEKPICKTEFLYKKILPTITCNDIFYNDKIKFVSQLSVEEKQTIGSLFKEFEIYSIQSGFNLNYSPRYKKELSEQFAYNALEELKWFNGFAKKLLMRQDVFMVVNLWLGKKIDFNLIKTNIIEVNDWELADNKEFEFEPNIVYQFADNSKEAINARLARYKAKITK